MATLPPFLAACLRQPTAHTPIWIMRQAGRYLPEYRALRQKHDFLALMRTPELAAAVTLQPVRRFPLDAAILFADIMTPLDGLGLGLRFAPGPALERPVRSAAAVEAFALPDIEETAAGVMTAIRAVRGELPAHAPLICFAGAPFTLFCYLVEGASAEGFPTALAFLRSESAAAERLLDKLADLSIAYLTAQACAGAQALMLFDTLVDRLEPSEFERTALPAARKVLAALEPLGAPRIYFPRSAQLLAQAATLPVEVMGVEAGTPLSRARSILGPNIAVQGNLDPAALLAADDQLDARIDEVLREAGPEPGHIFNLGHGIDPATDPDKVSRLVERVHRLTVRAGPAR